MKKMYNNPQTEAVELLAGNLMLDASIMQGGPGTGSDGEVDAPIRIGNRNDYE